MKYIIGLIFLTGCSSIPGMPGHISSYESKADGVKHITVEPGHIPGWAGIKLGLHQTSTMKSDEVVMIVQTRGNAASTKNGLLINVDGEKTYISSIDDLSDVDQYGFFTKRFEVKLDLVRKMVNGKSVWVKISYIGQSYVEGEFSIDQPSSAKRAFLSFLEELDKTNPRVGLSN